jgi:pyruvate/2-oxoglutarate dehydrogenase complex dihydrolipoamide acyltransferase (E2) component
MLQQTLGDITPQIQRAAAGANFQAVEKLTKAGAELQNIATALDTANPNWNARPLHKLTRLIQSAVDKMTQGDNKAETLQKLNAGDAQQLMTLLNHVREQLYSIHNIY